MKKILKKILKKIFNKIYIFYLRNLRKYIVLSSYPFISGDTFKKNSDHVLDYRNKINYKKISSGDIIFVKPEFLDEFFREFNYIDKRVSLITHNSDFEINYEIYQKYANKNINWFAQNISFKSESNMNIFPLPIGLENRNYFKNGIISHYTSVNIRPDQKLNKALCSFNLSTNKDRVDVVDKIKLNKDIDFQRFANHKYYIQQVSNYKFNICPFGNGLDTHRIWESLMVNTIPVVLKHDFYSNFSDYDIPLLQIDSWDDLKNLNSEEIERIYDKYDILKRQKHFLEFDFWFEKIKESSN